MTALTVAALLVCALGVTLLSRANDQSVGNLRWKRHGATLREVVYMEPGAVPPYA